ncbi:MAG: RNB domain-containing ribonuclease [Candidatus Eiseniibacteriota bacterium]|jgi:exoribonuclease-2
MSRDHRSHRRTLYEIAHQAMLERDLVPDFPREIQVQLRNLRDGAPAPATLEDGLERSDLRHLPWASIDNDDSLDLDQLTVAEPLDDGAVRMRIAVADVDALVGKGTAIDDRARHNTTTVYTSGGIFPMLPERLSTDLTSLNADEDRAAIVTELDVDRAGRPVRSTILAAVVRNRAKLAYDAVAAWLDGEGRMPSPIGAVEGLEATLRLQDRVAQRLRARRYDHGALDLETIQTRAEFEDDRIVALRVDTKNRARELIEDFMIAANGVTARFLRDRGLPSLRRVVREPQRWGRIVEVAAEHDFELPETPDGAALSEFLAVQRELDPLRFPDLSLTVVKLIGSGEYVLEYPGEAPAGHFGLAVRNYMHSTAPNRRFPDLITQRLVKSALGGTRRAYDARELADLGPHCTRKEDDADKVERRLRKSAAALLLEDSIGKRFEAIVTGASEKGTWVRILDPHVEGMLVEGGDRVDVGDRLQVELIATDVERGYIDFRKVRSRS